MVVSLRDKGATVQPSIVLKKMPYRFWRVDDPRVVAELQHPEDGGEDAVPEEERQALGKGKHSRTMSCENG